MSWSAAQYLRFEEERTRPVRDLVHAIPTRTASRVVDLGCGPGNSTEVLATRYPTAHIVGIDGSEAMCAEARRRLPGVRIENATIEAWHDTGPWDVILCNAVLQWVPDHEQLLPRLAGYLAKGGSLAVQLPDNLLEPAQLLMREIAAQPRWASRLSGAAAARAEIASEASYFELLRSVCDSVDVWRTTYLHFLPGGVEDIVEWFKGTGLRPFLQPLEEAEQAMFLAEYRRALERLYRPLRHGGVLLPFPRLFLVAARTP